MRNALLRIFSIVLLVAVATSSPQASVAADGQVVAGPSNESLRRLLGEMDALRAEAAAARASLAEARLAESQARRELEELRQFIIDHEELGPDFERYKAVRDVAEREAAAREADANRVRREDEREQRAARREAMRREAAKADAEENRLRRYRDAGFGALGLDVFASRMGFSYEADGNTTSSAWVDYEPLIGFYYRPGFTNDRIDYSAMTISGSILNAAAEPRNIGVAITFFDENGNQVGSEVVQVNNARMDVPYPFTSKVQMALNRPFSSSSAYVLYADPAE